jgi:hypothetical protein
MKVAAQGFAFTPPNETLQGAYSERWRSAFRGDGDHDSERMPITIPR